MEQQVRELVAQVQLLTAQVGQQERELRAAADTRAVSLQQMVDLQAQVIAQVLQSQAAAAA